MSTPVIFLRNDILNITLPSLHGVALQFSVKDFAPQYMHYVRP